jgi:hypothetical protein
MSIHGHLPCVKELGKYQYEWLNKYGSIDLCKWRFVLTQNDSYPEWVYVGEWVPGIIEPYPSNKDGGYKQRQSNLEKNIYHYWPKNVNE